VAGRWRWLRDAPRARAERGRSTLACTLGLEGNPGTGLPRAQSDVNVLVGLFEVLLLKSKK
jgi:hypothetical protein